MIAFLVYIVFDVRAQLVCIVSFWVCIPRSLFTLGSVYVLILFKDCLHLFKSLLEDSLQRYLCLHQGSITDTFFFYRTITKHGKSELIKVSWISPRLLSLLDYLMHKAPYWSIHNYEKRLDEDVRESFMRHVLGVHKDSRDDLAGLRGEF